MPTNIPPFPRDSAHSGSLLSTSNVKCVKDPSQYMSQVMFGISSKHNFSIIFGGLRVTCRPEIA